MTIAYYPKSITFACDLDKPDCFELDFCIDKGILQAKHLRQLKRRVSALFEKMAKAKSPLLATELENHIADDR